MSNEPTTPLPCVLRLANVSRRQFLGGLAAGGALVIAARWDLARADDEAPRYGADAMPDGWVDDPNVFIRIDGDGTVTVVNHRSEMGQGIRTSLAMVVADELGADWDRVRVEQAPGDQARYGNQDTDGSRSMRHWFDPMRRAAAAARTMLEQAAALEWDVPASECVTRVHEVAHEASGRVLGFGALAADAANLQVPDRNALVLRAADQWRYIGKDSGPSQHVASADVRRPLAIDGEDIVSGRAVFGADVQLDDMLYAVVARPPVLGARVAGYDDSGALEVPDVVRVVQIEPGGSPPAFEPLGGVAVIARNTWAAIEGRRALQVDWDLEAAGNNATYDTDAYRESLEQAARSPGRVIRSEGDIDAALSEAASTVEATYYMPHMAHAPMEPPAAVARILNGVAEVWAPVQNPHAAREGVAARLGLDYEHVTVHVTLLGGGFGRKSKPDFAIEAAVLSQAMDGQPVLVQWTRDDDLHHCYFHALSVERLEAGLDGDGRTVGWRHRSLAPTIFSIFAPDPRQKAEFELGMGFNTLPFAIPSIRLENPEAPAHVRIGWFRAVYNLPHAFAIQCFAAELAAAAGRDHRDYLLELLGPPRRIDPRDINEPWNYGEDPELYPIDTGRLRAVIERATAEAGWGSERPAGRGLGLAVHHSFVSYAAVVFDVEVDDGGTVVVHSADVAFDCGPQINPDRIRSQMEGSVVMGIGIALHSEITVRDGRVVQDNFDSYRIPRISHAPRTVRVHLVNNDPEVPLGGVGEPGLPPVAPALCNAIYAATGRRIRRLPVGNQLA